MNMRCDKQIGCNGRIMICPDQIVGEITSVATRSMMMRLMQTPWNSNHMKSLWTHFFHGIVGECKWCTMEAMATCFIRGNRSMRIMVLQQSAGAICVSPQRENVCLYRERMGPTQTNT